MGVKPALLGWICTFSSCGKRMGNEQHRHTIQYPRQVIGPGLPFLSIQRTSRGGSGGILMRVEHPVRDCIVHEIGATAKFQFVVNSVPIGLDGSLADAEFPCNSLCRKTSCYS